MSEEKSFRKATVGGFNRKDVIDYIEQLLIERAASQKELSEKDKKIAELENQINKLKHQITDIEYERESVSAIITESDDPDTVLKKVDLILQSYLGSED